MHIFPKGFLHVVWRVLKVMIALIGQDTVHVYLLYSVPLIFTFNYPRTHSLRNCLTLLFGWTLPLKSFSPWVSPLEH